MGLPVKATQRVRDKVTAIHQFDTRSTGDLRQGSRVPSVRDGQRFTSMVERVRGKVFTVHQLDSHPIGQLHQDAWLHLEDGARAP